MSTCWTWSPRAGTSPLNRAWLALCVRIVHSDVLHSRFVLEACQGISPCDLLTFTLSILRNKFINMHKSTTNSDHYCFAFLNFNINSFRPKLINSFTFSQKHDFHGLSFRIAVQVISERHINLIVSVSNIYGLFLFKLIVQIDCFLGIFLGVEELLLAEFELLQKV